MRPSTTPAMRLWMMRALIGMMTPLREITVFDAANVPADLEEACRRLDDFYRAAIPRQRNLVETVNIARFVASVRAAKEEIAGHRLAIVESGQGASRAEQLFAQIEMRACAKGYSRRSSAPPADMARLARASAGSTDAPPRAGGAFAGHDHERRLDRRALVRPHCWALGQAAEGRVVSVSDPVPSCAGASLPLCRSIFLRGRPSLCLSVV